MTGPGLPSTYGVKYQRVNNAELISQVNYMSGESTMAANVSRTYETSRDVLLQVQNYRSATLVSQYSYAIDTEDHGADAIGRRTKMTCTGPAFYTQYVVGPLVRMEWAYNDRNEVIQPYPYRQGGSVYVCEPSAYAYDPIGNRSSMTTSTTYPPSTSTYYCRNALNQHATGTVLPPVHRQDRTRPSHMTLTGT